MLKPIKTKHLKVVASTTILRGSIFSHMEKCEFSGKVYPYIEDSWDGDIPNIDCFAKAKSLKHVDGSLGGDNCWIFKDCESLESVHLSNGILKVPPHAFENCKSLVDLYIPDTVTEIGAYAFANCENLRTIHLPNNIRTIPKGLFQGCKSLTKCFLSDEIEFIEDDAFKGCVSMKKPWIPKSIKKISETAFDNHDWNKIF